MHYAHFSQLVNGSRWTFSLIFSSSNLAVCRDVTIQPLTSTKQARISLDNTLLRLLCLAPSSQRLCFVSSSPVSTRQVIAHCHLVYCTVTVSKLSTIEDAAQSTAVASLVWSSSCLASYCFRVFSTIHRPGAVSSIDTNLQSIPIHPL